MIDASDESEGVDEEVENARLILLSWEVMLHEELQEEATDAELNILKLQFTDRRVIFNGVKNPFF